jgi:hypothetical protein
MSSHFNTSYYPPQQTPFADGYSDGYTRTSALAGTTLTPLEADVPSGYSFFSPQVSSTSGESVDEDMSPLSHEFLDSLGLPSIQPKSTTVSIPLSLCDAPLTSSRAVLTTVRGKVLYQTRLVPRGLG